MKGLKKMKSDINKELLIKIGDILSKSIVKCDLALNYAKICYGAMDFLKYTGLEKERLWPLQVQDIYDKYKIDIKKQNLNDFMEAGDVHKINQIIGRISIRPDYFSDDKEKITVYTEETESPAMINYALAHELCHFILYYNPNRDKTTFYTDDYWIMPMLPTTIEELIADAFAIFILIPFDKFLLTFRDYVLTAKREGNIPIRTEEWLNYLSAVSAVPYYYVACGYQQIRHVALLLYKIHTADEEKKREYEEVYGKEVMDLYDMVKGNLNDDMIFLLYQ